MANKQLNIRQKKFADLYLASGNITQSYKDAYGITDDNVAAVNGKRLLRNAKIDDYIEQRQEKVDKQRIATLQEIQEFWTKTMMNTDYVKDKLKASELLARSQGGFLDRSSVEFTQGDVEFTIKASKNEN